MNDPIGDDPRHGLKISGLAPNARALPVNGANASESAEAASAVDSAAATAAAEIGDPAAIAEALAAGAIDAESAQTQLIDAVVAAQMPANATAEVTAALRSEVEAMLAGSPLLATLLRPS